MTLHTRRHGYMHTVLHAHIFVSLFWPAGHFLPNWPFCFSSSQQRHDCGVVASQSVAACGFPRVSLSFRLSSPLFLSRPPPPFPSLSFSAQLSLCFLCFFITFAFFLFSCKSLPPSFSLSLSLSLVLSLFFPFSSSSGLIEVQYCMLANCFPSLSTISDGLLQHTTQHVGCWAWEAQAFALYNHVRLLLQSLNHAKSEHLLPAHSRRVGPSA